MHVRQIPYHWAVSPGLLSLHILRQYISKLPRLAWNSQLKHALMSWSTDLNESSVFSYRPEQPGLTNIKILKSLGEKKKTYANKHHQILLTVSRNKAQNIRCCAHSRDIQIIPLEFSPCMWYMCVHLCIGTITCGCVHGGQGSTLGSGVGCLPRSLSLLNF